MTSVVLESGCESIGDLYQRALHVFETHKFPCSAGEVVNMEHDNLRQLYLAVCGQEGSLGSLFVFSVSQYAEGKFAIICKTNSVGWGPSYHCASIIGSDSFQVEQFEGNDPETLYWGCIENSSLAQQFVSACLTTYEYAALHKESSAETI